MARKDKTLSNVFNQQTQEAKEIATSTQETEQENVTLNSNNSDVTEDVIQKSNTGDAEGNVTVKSAANDFKSEFKEIMKKQRVEDTHERTTFLFRKDLKKRLDRISKKEGKGFKTRFMNKAIEVLLDEWEK